MQESQAKAAVLISLLPRISKQVDKSTAQEMYSGSCAWIVLARLVLHSYADVF